MYDINENEMDYIPMQQRGAGFQTPLEAMGSTILKLTNTEDELRFLELTLKGQYEDEDGKLITYCDPMMNDLGIISIMRLVRSVVNRITIMSNLEREIPALIGYLSDVLIKNLMFNYKLYGIKNISTRSDIAFIVQYQSFMAMRRAYFEGDKRFLKSNVQELSTRVMNENKSGSLMKRFMNIGK